MKLHYAHKLHLAHKFNELFTGLTRRSIKTGKNYNQSAATSSSTVNSQTFGGDDNYDWLVTIQTQLACYSR